MVDRVEALFGVKVPLAVLFTHATLEQFTQAMRDEAMRVQKAVLPIQAEGPLPPIFVSVRGSPPSLSCRADRDYRFGMRRARSWREGNSDAGSGRGESRVGGQAVCRWPRTAARAA
jgi:hypothetical protein